MTGRSATATLLALFLLDPLAVCNTIADVGKDISAVGEAISGAAEKTRSTEP